MPPSNHRRLGFSSAHRWTPCPGSIRMSEGIKEEPSPYAEEGSAAHFLGETCFRKARVKADYYQGRVIRKVKDGYSMLRPGATLEEGDFEVTEEMCEAVQDYLNSVRIAMNENPALVLEVEKSFDLSQFHPDLGGTNDAVLSEPFGALKIFDYKHGAGYAVEVDGNVQLMGYALGACLQADSDEIELVIVQPRARHPRGPVRSYKLTQAQLLKWANETLVSAANATDVPNAPLHAGDWCRFCKAKAVCPELHDHAVAVVKSDLSTVPLPAPEALSTVDLVRVLQSKDLLLGWLKAVEGHALSMLKEGQEGPGYKRVRGRANRKWKELAASWLEEHLPGREIWDKKLKGIPAIEKVIKHDGLKVDLTEIIEKPEGALAIAPEADKRPAVNLADKFTDEALIPEFGGVPWA